jgi:hypothetical protein
MSEFGNDNNHTNTNDATTLTPTLSTDTKTAFIEFRKVYELAEIAVPLAVTAAFIIGIQGNPMYIY